MERDGEMENSTHTHPTLENTHTHTHPLLPALSFDGHVHVWLLHNEIEVFVKPVHQKGQQLMRVLLLIARELRGKPPHHGLGEWRLGMRLRWYGNETEVVWEWDFVGMGMRLM